MKTNTSGFLTTVSSSSRHADSMDFLDCQLLLAITFGDSSRRHLVTTKGG